MLENLFRQFDHLIVLDTETTGISPKSERIIELAAVLLTRDGGTVRIKDEFDLLIKLPAGRHLPQEIVNLTGITEAQLEAEGVDETVACHRLTEMLQVSKPLVVAYNAQFDLCFLYYFLARHGVAGALQGAQFLDALTVYKDRRPYPHKLANAVDAYELQTQNTHRAVDDAKATVELICAMEEEEDDLGQYLNLFGYNPKYGVPKPRIASIEYVPQPYNAAVKLYERKQ